MLGDGGLVSHLIRVVDVIGPLGVLQELLGPFVDRPVVLLQGTEIVGLGMLLSLDVRSQTGGKEGGSKNGSAGGVGHVLAQAMH